MIKRYELLSPSDRREAIRGLLAAKDFSTLRTLADDHLLPSEVAARIETDELRSYDEVSWNAIQDLERTYADDGTVAPLSSPVAVTAEAIRASLEFFEKESLNEPTLHVVERYGDHGQNETPEALAEIQRLLEKQQLADDRRAEQAARAAAEGTGDEP